ncbi:MAG: AAA family ATPase [Bdellovibrio sp.]|nr:MAG: AAA family ATPase [Bdellovibrio sp.]
MHPRRLTGHIEADLPKKMVLLAGPRQCGKTSLAKDLVRKVGGSYYNWDIEKDRRILVSQKLDAGAALWALDEIHKYRRWRNWLKGIYDEHGEEKEILVTGSAKLDVYGRGGDSLQGRYFFYRLHPLTFSELTQKSFGESEDIFRFGQTPTRSDADTFLDLLNLGGFPEPLFSGSTRFANRWRLLYGTRILREEVASLEHVLEIDKMEMLFHRIPDLIQSPISINGLREDLEVAFETVRNWLKIFENLYLCFAVSPFGPSKLKAVKKEKKLYFWDWSRAISEPARMENLIATHLLRLCHWIEDIEGQPAELRYFRTRAGAEVDFVILKASKPWMAVEVKTAEQSLDRNLKYLLERVKVPWAFQVHLRGGQDWLAPSINGARIRVLPAVTFLSQLP